ncbi:MAG: UvrD-helicase domain-containing protein, partial [Candidatus Paceibacterota bacterium]
MNNLTSDSRLIDLDHHFRISAGPGAGKTHWLIEHIKNVLKRSENLHRTRKLACITYTNIAVETILGRLNNATDHVEVSTFHSFLYRHLAKPYIHNLADEYNINVSNVDGHDEMRVSLGKAKKWIENHQNKQNLKHPFTEKQLTRLPDNLHAIRNWLQSMKCQMRADYSEVE